MNIYVDIDGTITKKTEKTENTKDINYNNAIPIYKHIEHINKLYENGFIITYWTGRGTITKIDWTDITKEQLNKWGAKYHHLLMGKPAYDLFIDDKSINAIDYFNQFTNIKDNQQNV
jgi:uncharacterized HAD superfamily protein